MTNGPRTGVPLGATAVAGTAGTAGTEATAARTAAGLDPWGFGAGPDDQAVSARSAAGVVVLLGSLGFLAGHGSPPVTASVAAGVVAIGLVVHLTAPRRGERRAGVALTYVALLSFVTAVLPGGAPAQRLVLAAATALALAVLAPPDLRRRWWRRARTAQAGLVGVGLGVVAGPLVAAVAPGAYLSVERHGAALATFGVLGAVLVEEAVFRGALIDGLGGRRWAVLGAAVVWAAAMAGTGLVALMALAAVFGLALGTLRVWSGALWPVVVARAVAELTVVWWWTGVVG